jgi:hypothetical protein
LTKAPKNWQELGYILPDVIDPEENICICVPVPKDWGHIRAFLGQITELSKWLTWEKDGTDAGARAARRWFDIATCVAEEIDCAMATNCGCNSNDPILLRYSPTTGRLEQSTDGGETWHDAPDARYDSPLLPPHDGDTVDDIKCITAANAVEYFKTQLIDQATSWTTLAQVAAGIVAIVLGVLTGGIGAALAVELASIFIQAGISTAVAAFTSDVYTRFKCNLYCNSLDDGSWDAAAIQSIRNQLNTDETATALSILQSWLDQLGPAGLTNSGRLHLVAEADCSDCDCECGGETIGLSMAFVFGTDSEQTGCNVQATSAIDGAVYSVTWQWDGTNPFKLTAEGLLSGSTGTSTWQWYDGLGAGPFLGFSAPIGGTLSVLELSGTAGEFRVSWDVATP